VEKKGTEKRKPTDFSRDFSSDSAAEFVDKQMKARAMDIWFGLPRGAFCSKCARTDLVYSNCDVLLREGYCPGKCKFSPNAVYR